jgi:dienelactone hydrolase
MSRFCCVVVVLLVGGVLLAGAPLGGTVAFGQEKPMSPKITTVDGVKLNATFYPSAKKNSPVVIMVHPIGEGKSSKSPEWKSMAEYLQSKDYAVITFDLRGHGDSTTVDPDIFWGTLAKKGDVLTPAQQWTRKNVKQSKENDVLEVKDFIKNPMYLPALCNDIAAVRAYLDRQNDMGDCNTGNIFVLGADNGATLAALWINSEWSRFKATPNPMFPKMPMIDKRAEGNDITGAVFLTIQNNLDPKRTMKVSGLLKNACRDHGMGAVFIYGSEDAKAESFAKDLEKSLKAPKSKKHDFITAFPRTTNLGGVKLLQNGLKTEKEITDWFDSLVADRGVEWAQREFVNTGYILRLPTGTTPQVHRKGEKNLEFQTFEKFITP